MMGKMEFYKDNTRTVGDWHKWFAWRPVFVYDCGWVWLRSIERQYTRMTSRDGRGKRFVYYRPIGSNSFSDESPALAPNTTGRTDRA
jgi:hypothetical protein